MLTFSANMVSSDSQVKEGREGEGRGDFVLTFSGKELKDNGIINNQISGRSWIKIIIMFLAQSHSKKLLHMLWAHREADRF